MIKSNSFLIFCLSIFILGCTEDRFYEENKSFDSAVWTYDNSGSWKFTTDSSHSYYDLTLNVRHGLNYPYRNLYIEYSLLDESGNKVLNALKNYSLFEPKSGKPLGKESNSIVSHRLSLKDSVLLEKAAEYQLKVKQMMRTDSLQDIYSVGLLINTSNQ